MSKLLTKQFWIDTAERAVSTAAQAAILVIGADQINIIDVDWLSIAGFSAGGAALTILKALAFGRDDTASVVKVAPGTGKRRLDEPEDSTGEYLHYSKYVSDD